MNSWVKNSPLITLPVQKVRKEKAKHVTFTNDLDRGQ